MFYRVIWGNLRVSLCSFWFLEYDLLALTISCVSEMDHNMYLDEVIIILVGINGAGLQTTFVIVTQRG